MRQFQKLALLSEADGHLQQKLKQLLKLSKEKWDSACDHGKTAVQVRVLGNPYPGRSPSPYESWQHAQHDK